MEEWSQIHNMPGISGMYWHILWAVMDIIVMMFLDWAGNAKQPNILGQMIAEAREIRENQSYRSNAATSAAAGAKQNHAEESVSETCLKLNQHYTILISFTKHSYSRNNPIKHSHFYYKNNCAFTEIRCMFWPISSSSDKVVTKMYEGRQKELMLKEASVLHNIIILVCNIEATFNITSVFHCIFL